MVTTSSDEIDKSCRAYRDHSRFTKDPNYTEEIGATRDPLRFLTGTGRWPVSIRCWPSSARSQMVGDKIGDDGFPSSRVESIQHPICLL